MPFIIAIEPDRRKAARIAALARHPLNVEIIVTDSAEKALSAIEQRIPDLILTSLLLSHKDEGLLDARLRDLDAAGSHVQTLVIPVLGSTERRPKKDGGLLNRLRRSAEDEATEGCDPAVFAEQIAEYLERAAADRAIAAAAAAEAASDIDDLDATDSSVIVPTEVTAATEAAEIGALRTQTEVGQAWALSRVEALSETAPRSEAAVLSEAIPEAGASGERAPAPLDPVVAEFAVGAHEGSLTPGASPTPGASDRGPGTVAARGKAAARGSDDWGCFDPQQIGFAALLQKLQEAT